MKKMKKIKEKLYYNWIEFVENAEMQSKVNLNKMYVIVARENDVIFFYYAGNIITILEHAKNVTRKEIEVISITAKKLCEMRSAKGKEGCFKGSLNQLNKAYLNMIKVSSIKQDINQLGVEILTVKSCFLCVNI